MTIDLNENIVRVVVLDISSAYAQIYDQGYFDKSVIDDIKKEFSDTEHWRVVVFD